MTNYITITELANDLGIYEFEVRLVNVSGGDFAVGNTLTGGTSSETMVISRKISNERFYVNQVSGEFTLGETVTSGSVSGKIVIVKKVDTGAGNVTLDPPGSVTIDGAATKVLYHQYETMTCVSDGTNWFIV